MSLGTAEISPTNTSLSGVEFTPSSMESRSVANLARTIENLMVKLCDKEREISALKATIAQLEANEHKNRKTPGPRITAKGSMFLHSPGNSRNNRKQPTEIEFAAVGSNTLPLFNAARNSTITVKKSRHTKMDPMPPSPPKIPSPSVGHFDKNKSTSELGPMITRRASISLASMNLSTGGSSDELDSTQPTIIELESTRRRHTIPDNCSRCNEEPVFTDYKSLFKPNLIIEFAEDSPSFRRKVETLDQNVESLRGHLQQLVNTSRAYCKAGNVFCEQGREFSSTLTHLQGESWFARLGVLAPALVRFGETLDEIQNYMEALVLSLETTFSAPIEEFVKREVKSVIKMKQEVNRAGEEYETQLGRLLQLKRNSDETQVQIRSAEAAHVRRRFELGRFDLVHHLNQLETLKKFQLVERVCSGLYAFLGYFHQCHTLVATVEPNMRDLQHALNLARKDFAKDDRLWTAKRMQLESQLNKQAGAVGGLLNSMGSTASSLINSSAVANVANAAAGLFGNTNNHRRTNTEGAEGRHAISRQPANAADDSSEDDEDVLSHCNLSTDPDSGVDDGEERMRTSPVHTSVQPIKSGYLWKRSTNVRRDWKRRYFCIQGGKLYYQRQETSVSPPVLVCDIQLCTVRACEKGNDLRYSFEIISPKQRTYLLQAEDDVSHQSWIDAIRTEIEHLLSADSGRSGSQRNVGRESLNGNTASTGLTISPAVLAKLSKVNPSCVDCGASNPDWASINLGVMMCIECSGIHRSMGVHISKVRSLMLDRWSIGLLQLIEGVGNVNFNSIWEADMHEGHQKPVPDSPRIVREQFIRQKYMFRGFLGHKMEQDEANCELYDAARSGDMLKVMAAIAHGADLSWANEEEHMSTPAHQAVRGSQLAILELLSQNGASLDALRDDDITPLDIAMQLQNQDLIDLLVAKLEREQMVRGRNGPPNTLSSPIPAGLTLL